MSRVPEPHGRRERNKQAKLDRITKAAGELLLERGVDEVTTQEVADRADIGTGTLFLYVKTKGELLLLVHNARYVDALERGREAAADAGSPLSAVTALITPIVECNRLQVDNGRAYLRETMFGDPAEPYTAEALRIVGETEQVLAALLVQHAALGAERASTLAHVISAVIFLTMASAVDPTTGVEQIVESIQVQVAAILPGWPNRRAC